MNRTRADYCKKQMDYYAEMLQHSPSFHHELYKSMWCEYKREYDFYCEEDT